MSYTPVDITFDPWSSPITIDGVDYISDLDNAVNSIITDDPQSLVIFTNAQMAKLPPYLSAEMAKMYAEVEDSAGEAATSASNAATSESNAATHSSNASTAAASSNTYAGNSASSASNAANSETHAANSAISSGGSSAEALSSANLAEEWAQKAEDVEVETGLYSAFHWAQKAEGTASGIDSNGSNANGHWLRFTNGWMIQYGSIGITVNTLAQNVYGSTAGDLYKKSANVTPCLLYTSPSPRDS